ncbi:hypothetical protein CL629_01545 [bacterium]|nr:hypothetical protein [bacterium]|tara:strand:- start:623 stop:1219 length:597 start_codon:yes stop_codon:yes gene_type:complete
MSILRIRKELLPLLYVNLAVIGVFSVLFFQRKNYEFLIYEGVVVFFFLLIIYSDKKVQYPLDVLWGLSFWSLMHMAGGGIFIKGVKLYEMMILPLSSEYSILRYDQVVHIIGFGVATYLMYILLRPLLDMEKITWVRLGIVVVMAGLGVGALNEIIEFSLVVILPETGVGGYINTSLDLVADLVGALLALWYIKFRKI